MSKVIFFSVPSHGNVNPTLGLVSELIKQGEEITYFSSDTFKEAIEATGATYKSYAADLDIFKIDKDFKPGQPGNLVKQMNRVLGSAEQVIAAIMDHIKGRQFDYMIHSAAFPFAKIMVQLLKIPAVSSLAVFADLDKLIGMRNAAPQAMPPGTEVLMKNFKETGQSIEAKFRIKMPESVLDLIFNKGDINLVYTSRYFVPDTDYFDDSFKFVGPPIFERKENLDFPFGELKGKKVLYISLGTVFSNHMQDIYGIFFKAFADWVGVVIMTAYNVDLSVYQIPANFIVRNYVPQNELLKYTTAAITHGGMNSMSDLITMHIPFVAIPLGADQPALAKRAEELGATISLDAAQLNTEVLESAVAKVLGNPDYLENIKKIAESFEQAGGYPKAVEEIFKLKSKWSNKSASN